MAHSPYIYKSISLSSYTLYTHLAPADARAKVARFESLRSGVLELLICFYCRQPEAVFVSEVMAGAARAVALDEGRGTEIL